MRIHLKDFVWMSKQGEEPIQVHADPAIISQHMVAGYSQCEPPQIAEEE